MQEEDRKSERDTYIYNRGTAREWKKETRQTERTRERDRKRARLAERTEMGVHQTEGGAS